MPETVQILKESKARFEGVIFKQEADLGTEKSTSCKVIDEATGEVIAQSGGGSGESDFSTATVTITFTGFVAPSIPTFFVPITEDVESEDEESEDYHTSKSMIGVSGEYTVILYKGYAFGVIQNVSPESYEISVTGDAEVGIVGVDISGDCTITITAK